jgi:ketosteroid isomerase-like protein
LNKIEIIRQYFSLLENFVTDEKSFSNFMHPDFVQTELPNSLNPKGQESNFPDLLRRAAIGAKILKKQSYQISNFVESDRQIVIETKWVGTLATDVGALKAGQDMKAFFCIVCEFKGDKLYRQRNYDCFEPFA